LDQLDCSNHHWVQSANLFSAVQVRMFFQQELGTWEGTRVISKVTLYFGLLFTPYPFFQWYLQSKEILLNLSMKCLPFNAQGSRVIIVVVQVAAVKIYVAAMEMQDMMKLSLPPKLMEILICTPIILFCKIFIPNYIFDALLWWNWPFSLPSRVTLQITLLLSAKKTI